MLDDEGHETMTFPSCWQFPGHASLHPYDASPVAQPDRAMALAAPKNLPACAFTVAYTRHLCDVIIIVGRSERLFFCSPGG